MLLDPVSGRAVLLTLKALGIATCLFVLLGIPLGAWLGRRSSRLSQAVEFLVSLPLVFPPIATGFILLMLLGRRGPLGQALAEGLGLEVIFSFWALVVASFITGLPLMVKPIQAAFREEIQRLVELAQVLGRSRRQIFLQVVLPNIRRSVTAGLFLAILRSLGEVGVSLMLGGNIVGRTNTVSLEIYNAVFTGEYARAASLTVLLSIISLGAVLLLRRLELEKS
ncbi:molybdate ABC transporter permease [Desulfocarbo indianensis]|nr:molybdate ABC transporter permease [Desulfocarbo indianensis]